MGAIEMDNMTDDGSLKNQEKETNGRQETVENEREGKSFFGVEKRMLCFNILFLLTLLVCIILLSYLSRERKWMQENLVYDIDCFPVDYDYVYTEKTSSSSTDVDGEKTKTLELDVYMFFEIDTSVVCDEDFIRNDTVPMIHYVNFSNLKEADAVLEGGWMRCWIGCYERRTYTSVGGTHIFEMETSQRDFHFYYWEIVGVIIVGVVVGIVGGGVTSLSLLMILPQRPRYLIPLAPLVVWFCLFVTFTTVAALVLEYDQVV